MNISNKKIVIKGIVVLVLIGLFVYVASFLTPKILLGFYNLTGSQKMSPSNSFIIGERVTARADGEDKCIVNVFVIDGKGKGISGKPVQLKGLGSLTETTDKSGKAVFELKSKIAKQFELSASVNGLSVAKTVKVTFN